MIKVFQFRYILFTLLATFVICASLIVPEDTENENLKVAKLLSLLGDDTKVHLPNTREFGVSAKRGEALIKEGFSTRPGGGSTRQQSKHFVCTSCHNIEKEDPDLAIVDPQARLEYTTKKGLPFLQGTSLYGVVNRETYYNDDYEKKYGKLVIPARNDLREAIQLCAVECAQGRKLKSWEVESVLAYLWTIDLKISDLNMSDQELELIYSALDDGSLTDTAITVIKSKYLSKSPAHFGTAHESLTEQKSYNGDPKNGQLLYDNSCLHCHQDRKYSFFQLDNERLTFAHLDRKADGYGRHSLYQVSRYGVYSRSGKRSYMPQYTHERMSEQQLADLRAYIHQAAQ